MVLASDGETITSEHYPPLLKEIGLSDAVETEADAAPIRDGSEAATVCAVAAASASLREAREAFEAQIRDEIFHGRDLSKKGSIRRQVSYAKRTANKALSTVNSIH